MFRTKRRLHMVMAMLLRVLEQNGYSVGKAKVKRGWQVFSDVPVGDHTFGIVVPGKVADTVFGWLPEKDEQPDLATDPAVSYAVSMSPVMKAVPLAAFMNFVYLRSDKDKEFVDEALSFVTQVEALTSESVTIYLIGVSTDVDAQMLVDIREIFIQSQLRVVMVPDDTIKILAATRLGG